MRMREGAIASLSTQEGTVRQVSFSVSHCDTSICYTFHYKDLNPCAHLSPCENEGMCSNEGPNQYSCDCPSCYIGMDCEEDIDECNVFPCANQATCVVSYYIACTQKGFERVLLCLGGFCYKARRHKHAATRAISGHTRINM